MSDTESNHPSEYEDRTLPSSSEGRNNQFIDGRRFNNEEDIQYLLPNDDDEADRLHQQHWVMRYAFQRIYHAPLQKKLEEGISVIDSGCGPATWTFEMAEYFPNSKFTGVDISFVFPETIKPANVDLQISNITKELPFPDNTFDYFHQRLLILALNREDWAAALKNAYRILKPGGYIELTEADMAYPNMGPLFADLQNTMTSHMEKRGMITSVGSHLKELLEDAGFENIHFETKSIPINHTNKAGELWWKDMLHGYANVRPMLALTNPAFDDVHTFNEYIASIGAECTEAKPDFVFGTAFAQKPLDE